MHAIRRGVLILGIVGVVAACSAGRSQNRVAETARHEIFATAEGPGDGFRQAAEETTRKRLAAVAVTFDPAAAQSARLRLDLRLQYRNITLSEAEKIWSMTTTLLATLYPSTCQQREYTLEARLTGPDGYSRSYQETDSTVAWLWLFRGPRCGEVPSADEIAAVARAMLDDIYDRMLEDDAFAAVAMAQGAASSPLVHVRANRAQEIVDQVLRIDRPFEHWTMEEDGDLVPAHRIDLFFDVVPRGFSIHRAYMSILTLGLSGMCKSTPITLIATVTQPAAPQPRTFTATESVRGRFGDSQCEPQDERSRPEVFARLLRKILAAVKTLDLAEPVTTTSSPSAPWVLVGSNIAEGIVRAEIHRAAQIERYVFFDAPEYSPAYSLSLEFEYQGGGMRNLSAAQAVAAGLSIAWLGRNAGCQPTVLALDAVLKDATQAEVGRYRTTREYEFSGDSDIPDCRDNEYSNPEAVRELVHWLLGEMKRDGKLALLAGR